MKGDKCFLCDTLVETDNLDDLCNDCLGEFDNDGETARPIILAAGIVLIIVLLLSL